MIDDYFYEDFSSHPLIELVGKKREEQSRLKKATEKEYAARVKIIQNYFLHMSTQDKKKLMMAFLDRLSLDTVLIVMTYMSCSSKQYIFSMIDPHTNFTHDKNIFLDHDRMLDKDTLKTTIETDLEWFSSTIAPRKQVILIVELLKRAGGNVRRALYIPLLRKYHETLKKIKLEPVLYKEPTGEVIENAIRPDYEDYNPYHPASVEVEKQRKKWEAMINKYRSEVEKDEKKLKHQSEGPDTPEPKSKLPKAKGKGKNAAKDSSDKTKGKGKSKSEDELDWLQLLPIWIVKKIFGYLDQKSLKNMKSVNGYHAYVVQELVKEAKMRKKLDDILLKLQAEINPVNLEEATQIYKLPKLINREEVGVISERLVPKKKKTFVEMSMVADVAMESGDYLPNEVVNFPRVIKEDMLLYRYQPCFLKDINLALGASVDDKQSPFVTYSYHSQTDSSAIIVDEATLLEW